MRGGQERQTFDPEPAGHNPKDGTPPCLQEPLEERRKCEDYDSEKLRGVNGSSTEKRAQRPNKAFDSTDIREIVKTD